jgi:hypothetical protein
MAPKGGRSRRVPMTIRLKSVETMVPLDRNTSGDA